MKNLVEVSRLLLILNLISKTIELPA